MVGHFLITSWYAPSGNFCFVKSAMLALIFCELALEPSLSPVPLLLPLPLVVPCDDALSLLPRRLGTGVGWVGCAVVVGETSWVVDDFDGLVELFIAFNSDEFDRGAVVLVLPVEARRVLIFAWQYLPLELKLATLMDSWESLVIDSSKLKVRVGCRLLRLEEKELFKKLGRTKMSKKGSRWEYMVVNISAMKLWSYIGCF